MVAPSGRSRPRRARSAPGSQPGADRFAESGDSHRAEHLDHERPVCSPRRRRCVRRSGFGPGLLVRARLLGSSVRVGGVQGGDGRSRRSDRIVCRRSSWLASLTEPSSSTVSSARGRTVRRHSGARRALPVGPRSPSVSASRTRCRWRRGCRPGRHGDPEAGASASERRPPSERLVGQVVEEDEQSGQGVLGVLFAGTDRRRRRRPRPGVGCGRCARPRLPGPRRRCSPPFVCPVGCADRVTSRQASSSVRRISAARGRPEPAGRRAGPGRRRPSSGRSDATPDRSVTSTVTGCAVKGADLQTSGLEAALVVVEREHRSVVGASGFGLGGAVLAGVSQTVERRADRRRREVSARPRRPVAVGVAAAQPADGDRGQPPRRRMSRRRPNPRAAEPVRPRARSRCGGAGASTPGAVGAARDRGRRCRRPSSSGGSAVVGAWCVGSGGGGRGGGADGRRSGVVAAVVRAGARVHPGSIQWGSVSVTPPGWGRPSLSW